MLKPLVMRINTGNNPVHRMIREGRFEKRIAPDRAGKVPEAAQYIQFMQDYTAQVINPMVRDGESTPQDIYEEIMQLMHTVKSKGVNEEEVDNVKHILDEIMSDWEADPNPQAHKVGQMTYRNVSEAMAAFLSFWITAGVVGRPIRSRPQFGSYEWIHEPDRGGTATGGSSTKAKLTPPGAGEVGSATNPKASGQEFVHSSAGKREQLGQQKPKSKPKQESRDSSGRMISEVDQKQAFQKAKEDGGKALDALTEQLQLLMKSPDWATKIKPDLVKKLKPFLV